MGSAEKVLPNADGTQLEDGLISNALEEAVLDPWLESKAKTAAAIYEGGALGLVVGLTCAKLRDIQDGSRGTWVEAADAAQEKVKQVKPHELARQCLDILSKSKDGDHHILKGEMEKALQKPFIAGRR